MAQNKPLPSVPNERPPFIPYPSANAEPISERQIHQQRPSEHRSNNAANNIRLVSISNSASEESLDEEEEEEEVEDQVPNGAEHTHINMPQHNVNGPSRYHNEVLDAPPQHAPIQDDSNIILRSDVYKPPQPVSFSDEKEVVVSDEKEVLSPPLTGKDSAYSSVSGNSFASPTFTHPRSASAQSSHPRAQFGLFPSSTPSTPKHSISGRYGAISPGIATPRATEVVDLPPRAQTSLDDHAPVSRNRLLKKSSLTSLKRLFSKKKHSSVDTITE